MGALFERHHVGVRRLLVSILGPDADLDDLTQEVFIQAFRSLRTFKMESRFGTWLHRIAVNVAMSHLRSRRRPSALRMVAEPVMDEIADVSSTPDALMDGRRMLRHRGLIVGPELSGMTLSVGQLLAQVSPRPASRPFVLKSAHGVVVVHGTVFSVRVTRAGMLVRLHQGRVSIRMDDTTFELSPGREILMSGGSIRLERAMDRAAVIADLLITEKTAHLGGPSVPAIVLPREVSAPTGRYVDPVDEILSH